MPSCRLLQVFGTCTANWRGIWRKLKEQDSDGHLRSLFYLFIYLWLCLNKNLKQHLAVDTDPGSPLMSFALILCGPTSSSTSPPHFYSHWPHGTGITFPHITLLLWSHPLTVKPPLHQLPLAFLREPTARGQWRISLFLPTIRTKCDAIEWTEKHSDQLHVLSKLHLMGFVFCREYLH